jgi:hypothetical protein
MSDPFSALQPAVHAALSASLTADNTMVTADATAYTADNRSIRHIIGRVYDHVPNSPTFPYLRIDVTDITEDDDGCGKHWVCAVNVHIWSRATGRQEASEIAGPVRDALDSITTVTGYAINYNQFRQTRLMDDPDGLTTHGIVSHEIALAAT